MRAVAAVGGRLLLHLLLLHLLHLPLLLLLLLLLLLHLLLVARHRVEEVRARVPAGATTYVT